LGGINIWTQGKRMQRQMTNDHWPMAIEGQCLVLK
jgi:hypothetical protein